MRRWGCEAGGVAESHGAGSEICGSSSPAAESAPQLCHRDGLAFLHANTHIFKNFGYLSRIIIYTHSLKIDKKSMSSISLCSPL